MRGIANFILRGRLQASLVATVAAALTLVVPLFSHVSGGVIALVTLRNGLFEGLLIALGALLVLALVGYMSALPNEMVNILVGSMFLLMWAPVLITANVLRNTRSIDVTVAVAGSIGAVGMIVMYLFVGDVTGWWRGVLDQLLMPVLEQMDVQMTVEDKVALIEALSRILTGVLAATIVLTTMTNLMIGRWLQAMVFNPGGFGAEFRSLRLGRPVGIVALVVMGVTAFGSGAVADFGLNFLILLGAMYAIHGLALVHGVVERTGAHIAWLIALYVAIVLALPQVAMVLASAAFVDSWLDFRGRIGRRGGGPPANREPDDGRD